MADKGSPVKGFRSPFGVKQSVTIARVFDVQLLHDGSGNFTIIPGAYSTPVSTSITTSYSLQKNGVADTNFSPLVGADGWLTFTDATKDVQFVVVEKAITTNAKPLITQSNAVYVAAAPANTNIPDGSWTAAEAPADADTRKSLVNVSYAPAAGRSFYISRTSTFPPADPSGLSLAAMAGSGAAWSWTSTGQASLGQNQYLVVVERDTATDTNRRYCSSIKSFVASNVPGAPVFAPGSNAGQGEIKINIINAAPENGRALSRYEYSLDGGSWLTLPGGTALGTHTITGQTPVTVYGVRLRAVNVNGNGTASGTQYITSGAAATEPAQMIADTDWTLVDKPSGAGNTLTLTVINLPSDGGSALTDIKYTVAGGAPISFGLTPGSVDITCPVSETATSVVIYAQNAIGNAVGSSLTKTPTKTVSASNTAYFGADTPSGAGGWKPETATGEEIDLDHIVSQTGMTRTWSISGGALVANGTPDVDNGKTLTVATTDSNITVAISTIANARSVRTDAELVTASGTGLYAVPATIYLRPTVYTGINGSGTQFIGSRSYASTARRTFTKHPGQVKKPQILNTELTSTALTYCTIDNFRFTMNTGVNKTIWRGDSANVNNNKFTNCDFEGPDIPLETLTSAASFPSGYIAAPTAISAARSTSMEYDGNTFARMYSAANFGTGGAFRLTNCSTDTFYYDCFRLWPNSDNTPKIIKNIQITGAFGVNNEMSAPDIGEPHNDSIQVIATYGELRNALFMNIEVFRGPYRGNVMSMFMGNATFRYCVFHNIIGFNKGVWVGGSFEVSRWCNFTNSAYLDSAGSTSVQIRCGGPSGSATQKAVGEHVFKGVFVKATSGAIQVNANSETVDPGYRTVGTNGVDNVYGNNSDPLDYFEGPFDSSITSFAALRQAFRAKAGNTSIGPLDSSGNWRTEIHPPLRSDAPTLYDSGADLLIAPGPSLLAAETLTTWDYQYRNANGATWTKVTGLTGATATVTAPNKTGIQVQTRWVGSNGFKAPWSLTATSISSTPPLTLSSTITISRSGSTVSKSANATWNVTPDSRTFTKTINGTTTSWDGASSFSVSPGDSYYVTETAIKTGYSNTSTNSATGTYPILTTVQAPVIGISGTTVSKVTPPSWDQTPDSVTYTKTIAGTTTSWDGTSNFSVSAGQSAYVTATPAKSGYYVTSAVSQSNTVTALTKIGVTTAGTLGRSGNTITLTPTVWDQSGTTVVRTYSIDGGAAQTLSGTTFTLNPGSSATVTEAASKAGYADSDPLTTSPITNPAVGTVLTEDWSGYTAGDTFTQLDTLYGRNASNIDALVAADATGPAGLRISLTMSTSAAGYLRRDDTLRTDGTWGRFQIRARIKTQVHNSARGGIGWGTATTAYGIQVRRGSSSGTNTIVFLNGGDMSASTGGTTLFSSVADGAAYDLLLDIASDKRTFSYKVWATSGSEPGSYDGSVTLGADASLSSGLRLFGGAVSTGGNTAIRCLAWRLALDTDAVAF